MPCISQYFEERHNTRAIPYAPNTHAIGSLDRKLPPTRGQRRRRKIWSDESSILKEKAGVNYSIEFPERFAALTDVSSARVVGVDCSFKDPRDEASTLAIFINTLPPDKRTLKDSYVSIDSKAKQMALSAKNQRTKRKEKYTKQGVGEIWEIETEVGGGTAGRFGAAVELISSDALAVSRRRRGCSGSSIAQEELWRAHGVNVNE